MLQLQSRVDRFYDNLWYYHLTVSAEAVAPLLKESKERRVICKINEQYSFQCALMPDGQGDFFINLNKEIRNKLGLVLGQEVSLQLQQDESVYGLPVPPEFEELLQQDEEGSALFHRLTRGKQRSLIYQVGNVKNTDKRIGRGLVILEHLKLHQGKLDFKVLNAEMKAYNQQMRKQ